MRLTSFSKDFNRSLYLGIYRKPSGSKCCWGGRSLAFPYLIHHRLVFIFVSCPKADDTLSGLFVFNKPLFVSRRRTHAIYNCCNNLLHRSVAFKFFQWVCCMNRYGSSPVLYSLLRKRWPVIAERKDG